MLAAPEKMQVRSVKTVSLDLSPSQSQAFLDLELRSRLLEEYPEYQVVAATVEVSPRMQAKLEGFGFDVTNTSPEIQAVFQDTTTTWTWQIRPKQTGTLELFVSLNALVSVMEENTPYVVESYNKEVTVTVTVGQQIIYFSKNNWQWLWAVIVGPLLLLGWRNFNKTRQQKYESKTSRIWTPDKRDSD